MGVDGLVSIHGSDFFRRHSLDIFVSKPINARANQWQLTSLPARGADEKIGLGVRDGAPAPPHPHPHTHTHHARVRFHAKVGGCKNHRVGLVKADLQRAGTPGCALGLGCNP
jgi:hypothetical protein